MSDLVQRLRKNGESAWLAGMYRDIDGKRLSVKDDCAEAAAEIERLRDIISPGDAAAYEEGMAALLARCEAVEARLAEAHDLLALAAGVALLPSGVPALPLAIRERIAAWLRAQEPPR